MGAAPRSDGFLEEVESRKSESHGYNRWCDLAYRELEHRTSTFDLFIGNILQND